MEAGAGGDFTGVRADLHPAQSRAERDAAAVVAEPEVAKAKGKKEEEAAPAADAKKKK